ncbi:MAG: nuclear transport factor 2 family protein [Proteobacteria bacterium]|nr:nuclear transport factor 2 family protein [Pseudomonadota bacterium]
MIQRFCMLALFVIAPFTMAQNTDSANVDIASVGQVLDAYHMAASRGDWGTYFDLMSTDGVFLGTDAAERWTKDEFRAYAGNRSGWTYRSVSRNINLTPDGLSAWFDELLDSASYGTSRGTGVLIKTVDGWKISQYHLTFPIPNELSGKVTDEIKAFEAGQ